MRTGGLAMATQDEAVASQGPTVQPQKQKKKVSPLRNVLSFLLLIALSAIAFLEWNANQKSGAAIRKVNAALAKEEGDLLTMQQIQDMIGRQPDAPPVEKDGQLHATYTWRGVFRHYRLTAVYTKQQPPKLLRTE